MTLIGSAYPWVSTSVAIPRGSITPRKCTRKCIVIFFGGTQPVFTTKFLHHQKDSTTKVQPAKNLTECHHRDHFLPNFVSQKLRIDKQVKYLLAIGDFFLQNGPEMFEIN